MSRPSFLARLLRGRCNRWEQSLAGGIAGLVSGLLLCGAIILTTPSSPSPDAPSTAEAALIFGSMGAAFGLILGAWAGVRPSPRDASAPSPGVPEGREADWIAAFIWPREHSSPESLRSLGRELEAWWAETPSVTRLQGLERLRSGSYPIPDGPTLYVEDPDGELMPCPRRTPDGPGIEYRRMRVDRPWISCPALVYTAGGMTSDEAIERLRQAITPDLVSGIGYSYLW